ncbi:hypothetical protein WAI453_008088 [Rhynchosporium graminicola]
MGWDSRIDSAPNLTFSIIAVSATEVRNPRCRDQQAKDAIDRFAAEDQQTSRPDQTRPDQTRPLGSRKPGTGKCH